MCRIVSKSCHNASLLQTRVFVTAKASSIKWFVYEIKEVAVVTIAGS